MRSKTDQSMTKADLKKKKNKEAQVKSRAKRKLTETTEEQEARKRKHAEREATRRLNESQKQQQDRKRKNAEREAERRANESAIKKEERKKKNAEREATRRATESPSIHTQRINEQADRQAALRANQTEEQQLQERSEARLRMAEVRKYTSAGFMDATRSKEILQGTFKVNKLENTVDAIGTMTVKCTFCGALKFQKEKSRTTTCCSEGKVDLMPFPRPPEELMNLWMGDDSKSRLFRAHSRQFNNAVCISSLQVRERDPGGFNPSVVFQGRHHLRTGALLPAEGEVPVYAQLYVYDAALESTQR